LTPAHSKPVGGVRLVQACIVMMCVGLLTCCSRTERDEVVLYTSCDAPIAQSVIKDFESSSAVKVRLVCDTEAAKTTGLVQRLLGERDHPKADVWWSNEMLGTVQLAEMGLFEKFTPRALSTDFDGKWPKEFCDANQRWFGHAIRWRTLAYNTHLVQAAQLPATMNELGQPRWKGRVGMARPQFGTTRMHIAAMVALSGAGKVKSWLESLAANEVRLFDGNSAVVQALAHGEIDIGLTDTDDALEGKAQGWPVEQATGSAMLDGSGVLGIPNTVAIVKGAPHPKQAAALAEFLLSARCEKLLGSSEAHTRSVRSSLPPTSGLNPADLAAAMTTADGLANAAFAGR